MTAEIFDPNLIKLVEVGLLLAPGIGMALTRAQREWVIQRDVKCQFPARHKCNGTHGLQVHHVQPQRYAREALKLSWEMIDRPSNLISLCRNAHEMIHRDIKEARQAYKANPQSFKETFEKREGMLQKRQIYWDDSWDRVMSCRVSQLQDKHARELGPFPGPDVDRVEPRRIEKKPEGKPNGGGRGLSRLFFK